MSRSFLSEAIGDILSGIAGETPVRSLPVFARRLLLGGTVVSGGRREEPGFGELVKAERWFPFGESVFNGVWRKVVRKSVLVLTRKKMCFDGDKSEVAKY